MGTGKSNLIGPGLYKFKKWTIGIQIRIKGSWVSPTPNDYPVTLLFIPSGNDLVIQHLERGVHRQDLCIRGRSKEVVIPVAKDGFVFF
jgi:hypothetical protein